MKTCPTDIPPAAADAGDRALRRDILSTWRVRLHRLADDPAFVAFGLDCWRAFDRRLPSWAVPLVPRDPERLEWLLVAAAAWLDTCGNWERCCLSDDLRSIVRRSSWTGDRHTQSLTHPQ